MASGLIYYGASVAAAAVLAQVNAGSDPAGAANFGNWTAFALAAGFLLKEGMLPAIAAYWKGRNEGAAISADIEAKRLDHSDCQERLATAEAKIIANAARMDRFEDERQERLNQRDIGHPTAEEIRMSGNK